VRRQVLFLQGGGEGTHDEWDDQLVDSLRAALGDGFEVRYPRMPDEGDPSEAVWGPAISGVIEALEDGSVIVAHSIGGTLLIRELAERPPARSLAAIVLLAAPFVGEGGWPGDEFAFDDDLGRRLPDGVPIHLFHGLDDTDVPPAHADRYASVIPQAQVDRLPGRDHQFGNDLRFLADLIRSLPKAPLP
jgi:predicted alpha/beta hydrolase family esterase